MPLWILLLGFQLALFRVAYDLGLVTLQIVYAIFGLLALFQIIVAARGRP